MVLTMKGENMQATGFTAYILIQKGILNWFKYSSSVFFQLLPKLKHRNVEAASTIFRLTKGMDFFFVHLKYMCLL